MEPIKIRRVPILPFGMVNAHLIIGPDGVVAVDTGLPGSEKRMQAILKKAGLGFRDIKLIVITHAHVDHVGNAARIRELSGAPIVGHCGDLPYFRREAPMSFCPTGWFGSLFIRTRLMFEPYTAFEPDIVLQDHQVLNLKKYGIPGIVRHTPGHTAGSLTVELDDKRALVGDLIASGILLGGIICTSRAKQPPFEDDPVAVSSSLQGLVERGFEHFYMGHGGPLPAKEVARHAKKLRAASRRA